MQAKHRLRGDPATSAPAPSFPPSSNSDHILDMNGTTAPHGWCSLFTSHRFALKRTRVDNNLAVITSPRFDQVASSEWAVQCTSCKLYGTRSNVISLPITPWWLQCSHCRHQRSRRRRRHGVKNNELVLSSEIEERTIFGPHFVPCRLLPSFHHPLNRSDPVETAHPQISHVMPDMRESAMLVTSRAVCRRNRMPLGQENVDSPLAAIVVATEHKARYASGSQPPTVD